MQRLGTTHFLKRIVSLLWQAPFSWLMVVSVAAYGLALWLPLPYIAGLTWVPEPLYRPLNAGFTLLGGKIAPIPSYTYAIAERAVPTAIAMSWWPSFMFGLGLLVCFSALVACLSFLPQQSLLDKIRFWVLTSFVALASAFLGTDALSTNPVAGQILRVVILLSNAGGLYIFSQLYAKPGLAGRFSILLALNLAWYASLYSWGGGWQAYPLWAGYAAVVPLVLGCLFAFQVAYIFPYAALLLAVRQNINGVFAFLLIVVFGAGNVLLAYLAGQGLYKGALYELPGLAILALLALAGAGVYKRFVKEDSNWFTVPQVAKPLYWAWGGMVFVLLAWAQATQNGPVAEVLEDSTNLSLVCISGGFVIYVLVNFGVPLARRQRVDRVLFSPYQLPFSAVMAIGATATYIFLANNSNYQYYQAKAAVSNAVADGYFARKDYQAAEIYYQESVSNYRYNFHGNYMLAQLARAKGQDQFAKAYLQQACFIKGEPVGFIALAEAYRAEGVFIEQALALSEGMHKFSTNPAIASNLLITYAGSDLKDSVAMLASLLYKTGVPQAQNNALAAAALGKWEPSVAAAPGAAAANQYLGARPVPGACLLLKTIADTTRANNLYGYMALFNGLILCAEPTVSVSLIDSILPLLDGGFKEDMLYARAWLQWRSGQRLPALEDMQTLAQPGSLSAATYFATGIVWASEMGNPSLAAAFYKTGTAKGLALINPAQRPDSSVRDRPYAAVKEGQRAAWLYWHPAAFGPASLPPLLPEFKNEGALRTFVWQANLVPGAGAANLLACLPMLKTAKRPVAQGLDNGLAWAGARACLEQNVSITTALPAHYRAQLGGFGQKLVALQTKRSPELYALGLQAFPYSDSIWARAIAGAQTDRPSLQALFEISARAYALDKTCLPMRQRYIGLARRLNLDFFADEAEKEN